MPSVRALTYFSPSLEADKNLNHFMQVIKELETKTSLNPWTIRFTLKGNWRRIRELCNREYLVEAYHETLEEVEIEEPNEYLIHQEFTRILLKALGKGYICSFHKKIDKEVKVFFPRTEIHNHASA